MVSQATLPTSLASSPGLGGVTNAVESDSKGLYLHNCQFIDAVPHAKDPLAAERLWKLSEELVGEKFDLGA